MNIDIRLETTADYRAIEELTREAFWGIMDQPACDGEHLLVHKLRKIPAYIPELDFVAESNGKLVGHVIYSLAKVETSDGKETEVINLGPISVLPEYQKMGVGAALIRHSVSEAAKLGYRAIILYGHPDYYPRFGFRRANRYGITSGDGRSFDALMAMELYDGALDGINGRYVENKVFEVDPEELAEFDKGFSHKEPAKLIPIEVLTDQLPESARGAFYQKEVKYVSELLRFSGNEMISWEGMDEQTLKKVNNVLAELGMVRKLLPTSYILQLMEMGVRNPVCSLIRSKAGISLYRVESECRRFVLKVFDNQEDTREIDNYRMLSELKVPTLPLLRYTANAILLPDVDESLDYRLGVENDMKSPQVAKAIAKWYKELHVKGSKYLMENELKMYDESDVITLTNMKFVAERTGTADNELWKVMIDNFNLIRNRIDAIPRTLTYNDFYYTNLIVAKDQESAFMFDYNLLGKGMAYGDLRNVTSSLSPEAAEAFLEEYSAEEIEEQKCADGVISPLVTLHFACEQEEFPEWALGSLEELKNGEIFRKLKDWLDMEVSG